MMRVAYVCADPGVAVFGRKGCSIHVQEVLAELVRRGAEVHLFAMRWDGDAPPRLASVHRHPLPLPPRGSLSERELSCHAANGPLRRLLELHGPFDLIYERYSLFGSAGMRYADDRGLPGILEVNAPLIEEQVVHRGLAHRRLAEQAAETVFERATSLVAVSEGVAAYLRGQGVAPWRIEVIHNGVDPGRFPRPVCGGPPRDPVTIGFVGTLKPWHGLEVLAEAFCRLDDRGPRLLVVGDGPQRAIVQSLLTSQRAPRVEWTGAVAMEQVPALLERMDITVAPYPALDPFYFSPLKLFEYMAAGTAVVASCLGDVPRILDRGRLGRLVPAGDPDCLATALATLIDQPHVRQQIGTVARQAALRQYTWQQVVDRSLALTGAATERARRSERIA